LAGSGKGAGDPTPGDNPRPARPGFGIGDNFGLPVINGKKPDHKGHEVHRGKKAVKNSAIFVFFVVNCL
jgi:hypothetical protein